MATRSGYTCSARSRKSRTVSGYSTWHLRTRTAGDAASWHQGATDRRAGPLGRWSGRENVQNLLAVPGQLRLPDAAHLTQLGQRRRQRRRDLPQRSVAEYHVRGDTLLLRPFVAPG